MYDDEYDEPSRYEVNCRALRVDGAVEFEKLPMGRIVDLTEPLLGIPAGRWVTGPWQREYGATCPTRSLSKAGDKDLEANQAAGHAVVTASVAPDWSHPFPLPLEGMRLRDLRNLVSAWNELPEDTLVVLSPGEHPWEGRYSPASTHAGTGLYVPSPVDGSYGRLYETDPPDEEDRAPRGAVPALVLSPSN